MVANVRMLDDRQARGTWTCRYLDPRRTLSTMRLPWHAYGMTIPAALLCPAAAWGWVERVERVVDGLRYQVGEAFAAAAPPPPMEASLSMSALLARRDRLLADSYTGPIEADMPGLRMLAAAVTTAVADGSRVLVVIAPVPVDELAALGVYDARRYAARMVVIADLVRSAGGEVLDLHAALGADGFRDRTGHYSRAGTDHMVETVGGRVREILQSLRDPSTASSPPDS